MLWEREFSDPSAPYVKIFTDISTLENLYQGKISKMQKSKEKDLPYMIYVSDSYRNIGNKLFIAESYKEAMENYCISLCYVENGSERMAKAYGNRSTCFFHMGMYEKCIIDIELAVKSACPDDLKIQLAKLKTECLSFINNINKNSKWQYDYPVASRSDVPKLSFDKNEKFPCMADVMDINYSADFGFHITSKCDIDVGQTLLVEKFYSSIVLGDIYTQCSVCGKAEPTNFIPCEGCTAAMFCSEECANNNFHYIECDANLSAVDRYEFLEAAIFKFTRCVGKERNVVPGSIVDELSKYEAFLKILPDKDYVETKYCVGGIYFSFKFLMNTDVGKSFTSQKHQCFLVHLIWHHLSIGLLYGKEHCSLKQMVRTVTINLAFVNFSCTPNAVVHKINGSKCLTSIRPIKKGEQIVSSIKYDQLGPKYRKDINKIKSNRCKCDRCEKRSPEKSEILEMRSTSHFQFISQNFSKGRYNTSETEHLKENAIEFLRRFGRSIWCDEVALAADCLHKTLYHNYIK